MSLNHFIVVDGIDGSGKTSIIEYIQNKLKKFKPELHVGKGFGSGKSGKVLRESLFDKTVPHSTEYEVLAFITALLDCYETVCVPRLDAGETVILDRYITSFLAYQCKARNLPWAKNLLCLLFNRPDIRQPDLYIYCNVDVEVAQKRIQTRGAENYLDEETTDFMRRCKAGFDEFFQVDYCDSSFFFMNKAKTIEVIDANQSFEKVCKQIDGIFEKRFSFQSGVFKTHASFDPYAR